MGTDERVRPARLAYERRDWGEAYELLAAADAESQLTSATDLQRLGTVAWLTGRDEQAVDGLERAHKALLAAGEVAPAVRCAFWIGINLMQRGQLAPAGGWLARAGRLLEERGLDCVERGYLRAPAGLQALMAGDASAALAEFHEAVAIADRFGDADGMALGRSGRAQALVLLGDAERAVADLDEAMVAVTSDEVSPISAGIVYCTMVLVCRDLCDVRRATEWTAALSRWCDTQEGLRPYRGQCLVHRSEIMQLNGEWSAALDEVERACTHLSRQPDDPVLGMALYQRAELMRLRGELDAAEDGYRRANEHGHPVQPGLALLRLAQDRVDDAFAAARREVEEASNPAQRARLLAAFVEIAIAAGEGTAAREGADRLGELAADLDSPFLRAAAGSADGAVRLADGDAAAACRILREAWRCWQQLQAPYDAARTRLLLARACSALGDKDTAQIETDAARSVFATLRAARELAAVAELTGAAPGRPGGLTAREVEVLRLVATGASNRDVAGALVISEKTVARHLTNVFTKLGITSRAAATAYAYEHHLVGRR